MFGLVKVLFVNVSVPVSVAKSSPDNALLNSASEPEIVLLPRLIVLLVRVSALSANIIVPVASGKVCVLSAVGSAKLMVVSKASSVAPSNTMVRPGKVNKSVFTSGTSVLIARIASITSVEEAIKPVSYTHLRAHET